MILVISFKTILQGLFVHLSEKWPQNNSKNFIEKKEGCWGKPNMWYGLGRLGIRVSQLFPSTKSNLTFFYKKESKKYKNFKFSLFLHCAKILWKLLLVLFLAAYCNICIFFDTLILFCFKMHKLILKAVTSLFVNFVHIFWTLFSIRSSG